MGLFSKIRDYLSEEVEEEEEIEPVKPKVEPVKPISKPISSVVSKPEEPLKSDDLGVKKEEKFVFPVYFDDKDFDDITKKEETKPQRVEPPKRETRVDTHNDSYKESYNKKADTKEVKKTFKPTPIISPVYGILDKNYYKEDIVVTPISRNNYYDSNRPMTIDDVRKKAYGTLEDDLEKNLLYGSDLEVPKHGKIDDSIFNENDFADAIEKDKKRDISKDDLKSDIESLLDNKEFTKSFDYHAPKKEMNKETKIDDNITDDDITKVEDEDLNSNYGDNDESSLIGNEDEQVTSSLDEKEDELELPDNITNEKSEDLDLNTSYADEDLDISNTPESTLDDDLDYTEDENLSNQTDSMNDLTKMADNEIEKAYADNSDLNDSDLFNLIDSMYEEDK